MRAPPRPAPDLAATRRRFRDVPLAHVGSTEGDGVPHVVPLWFVWLEDAVYLTCREGSRVATNLLRRPQVAVSIDRGVRWIEHRGVLLRGRAESLPEGHPAARRALSAWFEKYREHLAGRSFAAYAERVERPVVIRVHIARVSGWDHHPPRR